MKELKYIKVFEAFESVKLSKTLNFIDSNSKNKFLDQLKQIANDLDLPLSKYNDDYFQYLPFKKALDLNASYEDKPCDATSAQAFRQYAVEGAVCEKGMIKRKWGRGVREVKCPICDGTGIKKKDDHPIKWIKFWFDKDGKYITTTGTDGIVRKQIELTTLASGTISRSISDYTVVRSLTHSDLRSLPTGSIVHITIGSVRTSTIGVIWQKSSRTYVIQNSASGNSSSDEGWRRYGTYSYDVSNTEYSGRPELLEPKSSGLKTDEVNPYSWNAPIIFRYGISLSSNSDMKSLLSGAHFAIVLDYLDLKGYKFKKKSDITSEREKSKSGATAFLKDEEIKRKNIQRYIDEISNRISISNELKEFNKTLIRFFGGAYAGIYVLRGRNLNQFSNFIHYVFNFMNVELSESDRKYYYDEAVSLLRRINEENIKFNDDLNITITKIKTHFRSDKSVYLPLLDSLLELNTIICNKIKSLELENIEDMDIAIEKINSIRNIWRNSPRFTKIKKLYYAIENFSNLERVIDYITDINLDQIEPTLSEMNKVKRVMERL
jgi:hypothetical protein